MIASPAGLIAQEVRERRLKAAEARKMAQERQQHFQSGAGGAGASAEAAQQMIQRALTYCLAPLVSNMKTQVTYAMLSEEGLREEARKVITANYIFYNQHLDQIAQQQQQQHHQQMHQQQQLLLQHQLMQQQLAQQQLAQQQQQFQQPHLQQQQQPLLQVLVQVPASSVPAAESSSESLLGSLGHL